MVTDNAIKQRARALYLTYDEAGRRKYTLENIATTLQQECSQHCNKLKINKSTISRWAKQYKWDEHDAAIVEKAVVKATVEAAKEREPEEEEKSDELAGMLKRNLSLHDNAATFLDGQLRLANERMEKRLENGKGLFESPLMTGIERPVVELVKIAGKNIIEIYDRRPMPPNMKGIEAFAKVANPTKEEVATLFTDSKPIPAQDDLFPDEQTAGVADAETISE